jgi:hypothetical protein
LTENRETLYFTLAASTILLGFIAISSVASAQTFNPQQQPPNLGDFNGTMPNIPPGDFNGSMGFPNGSMGPNGFNGTFGGPGGGNFTRPDVSGAPNGYGEDNGQVTGSQTDYTLIVETVAVAGVAAVIVAAALLVHKKKAAKFTPVPEATEGSIF